MKRSWFLHDWSGVNILNLHLIKTGRVLRNFCLHDGYIFIKFYIFHYTMNTKSSRTEYALDTPYRIVYIIL